MSIALLISIVIFLALVYSVTNGFQDGSSVTASPIASGAMTELQAMLVVAFFELMGALFGGSAVIGSVHGITSWPNQPNILPVAINGLTAAILWNCITRWLKLPSSSTHALVGGLLGAIAAAAGSSHYIIWGQCNDVIHSTGVARVLLSLFISPLVGVGAGYVIFRLLAFMLVSATTRINNVFRGLQWITVPILAFAHGANDTQKSMAVIMLALQSTHVTSVGVVPLWVRIITGLAMAFGVIMLTPGIVKRVGYDIFKLRPMHGFVVETASDAVILTSSIIGGPVATSQVITSAVVGVGTAQRMKAVHWLVAKDVFVAWFLTIPSSALLAWFLHITIFSSLKPVI